MKSKLVAEILYSGSEIGKFVYELKYQLKTLKKRTSSSDTDGFTLKKREE